MIDYSTQMTGKKLLLLVGAAAGSIPVVSSILVFGTTGKASRIAEAVLASSTAIVLAFVPFLIAAFLWPEMKRGKLAALVAFLIILIPWGMLTYSGWMTQSGHNMGGADIGTGLILLALPFVLTPLIRLIGGPSSLNNPS